MPRYRYDRDLDCLVEIRNGSNYFEAAKGPAVISDLEPYRAMGSDVACGGKRPVISGRRQHREYLQRNGYREAGTEYWLGSREKPDVRAEQASRVEDLKRALGDYGSNTGAAEALHRLRHGHE